MKERFEVLKRFCRRVSGFDNPDIRKGYYVTSGVMLCILMIALIGVSTMAIMKGYKQHRILAQITSTTEQDEVFTEANKRFVVSVSTRQLDFYLNITTNDNRSYYLGAFSMDYRIRKVLGIPDDSKMGGNGEIIVDVVYQVPQDWYVKNATDFNVSGEMKTRIQKPARLDPTFFRCIDYPCEIPFDEIEITTDFVSIYTDTNETEYNFIVRANEKSDNYNIISVDLMLPDNAIVR